VGCRHQFYWERNRQWPSIRRSTTPDARWINGLTFDLGRRGAWADSVACSSVCGLRAHPKFFTERNIYHKKYIFIKFNLKIAKMCETFPTLNMPLDMLCIPYKKKLLWSKSYLKLSNVPNLVALVQIL
jgi:hypothetical protein